MSRIVLPTATLSDLTKDRNMVTSAAKSWLVRLDIGKLSLPKLLERVVPPCIILAPEQPCARPRGRVISAHIRLSASYLINPACKSATREICNNVIRNGTDTFQVKHLNPLSQAVVRHWRLTTTT